MTTIEPDIIKSSSKDNWIKIIASLSLAINKSNNSIAEPIEYPDGRVYRDDHLIAEEPTYFDKSFFVGKMLAPARALERWFEHQYFTEEQKKELGLTDKDIGKVREH